MKDFADAIVRVRYAETDQMGVVYHGNYFIWFEVGRVELCRHLGFEYKQMEIDDDTLLVRTRVTRYDKRTVRFGYEILRQPDDELLATGDTTHVICDHHGRPKSMPEKYRKYFTDAEA